MFIKDFKKDFYDIIVSQHVLVIADASVDSVCAFKILQYLFRCDHVSYTLISVDGVSALTRAIVDHSNQVQYVVLLNCGATINLVDTISPPPDMIFFVLDSRRPFELDGVYDSKQVRLLIKSEEESELGIPPYDDIYRDDEESEHGDNSDRDSGEDLFASPTSKRHRPNSRPKDRRRWEEARNRTLFDYYEFFYYSYSTSILIYDLAWKLSKDSSDLLWWACVGLTSQLLERKINVPKYVVASTDLQQHLLRYNRAADAETTHVGDCIKMSFEKDLLLYLYRHWSLLESLHHTVTTACHFKSWTLNGSYKLLVFLADLGLPLTQCRQRFNAMDTNLRKEVHSAIESKLDQYGLNDLLYVSFAAQYSVVQKISAADAAFAISSALHFGSKKDLDGNFLTALDCLSRSNGNKLCKGIDQSKGFLKVLSSEVQTLLNTGQVIPHSSFLLTQLTMGTQGWCYFNKPHGLITLGHFLIRAFSEQRNGQKHKNKAMIVMAPRGGDESEWYLVAGIPPAFTYTDGDKPVNCLGQAFERVAERVRCRVQQNSFDNFVILLKAEDKERFCNAVSALLEV